MAIANLIYSAKELVRLREAQRSEPMSEELEILSRVVIEAVREMETLDERIRALEPAR